MIRGVMKIRSSVFASLTASRLNSHFSSGRLPSPGVRSVLFVVVTGEEKGQLGSKYFARRPTVPAASMIADINFDMFLPIWEEFGHGENEKTILDAAKESEELYRVYQTGIADAMAALT